MGNTAAASILSSPESLHKLTAIYEKFRDRHGSTIPILQELQEQFGYLPEEAMGWLSERFGIPESHFYGVATFYAQFHLKPRGKHIVTVCTGTACHVKGSDKIVAALRRELDLKDGEVTTHDRELTLETINCVGACSLAPVVIVSKKVLGAATTDMTLKAVKPYIKKHEGSHGDDQ